MMGKLTVGELKEFISDMSDDVEVRVASLYNPWTEKYYHVSVDDISGSFDATGSFLILSPSEVDVNEEIGCE